MCIHLLNRILQANALFSGLSGLTGLLFSGPIADVMGIGRPFVLMIVGGVLLLYAVDLAMTSRSATIPAAKVRYFIAMDVAWVIGSVVLLLIPSLELTGAGRMLIVVLAGFVAVFAALQYVAARKTVQTT